MYVIPAIDLKNGMCVRLRKGDFETVHKVAEDPVQTAKTFEADGAEILHVVDLDGALDGQGKNRDIVSLIARETKLKIELGGGLRDMESLQIADSIGVARMVIGSAATTNPEFVAQAVSKYRDRIIIGIDAKDGIVRTSGWTESSGMDYLDFAVRMSQAGVKYIIFTDIDRDGMLSGPSVKMLDTLNRAVDCDIIASGGVSTIDDLIILKELGMYGAIVGKAIYTGNVHLAEAIERCQ
ncbi:MAG: 1-(5-phosphoribosyl)-5-[(5-phosphoribosylamino)methylideneamino]imidazole-4-carboxamide isomerase [Clostridiales bacterium]|jgi:phosphoribosylformimino-5-aminoimidazole carboxamide ribotide isomerase|nr:1-(5-phosphoribosyl)-5-[(5-phosphoribosylamino)methylideneamino]imidazole-4-carboxamide isomerase [Clostridiales bacterium]